MQNGLFIFNFEPIRAGYVSGYIYFNNTIPLSNATLKSTLNNKEFTTDENGFFDIGFSEGAQEFIVNNEHLITINFIPQESTFNNFNVGGTLIPGDINSDSIINILDVVLVVNFILENATPTNEELWTSDLNQDTIINIQDIILLINLILD